MQNILILVYYLIRSDHPSNKKRGSICIYYENFLPLKVSDIRFLDERITFDLKVGNKLCNLSHLIDLQVTLRIILQYFQIISKQH